MHKLKFETPTGDTSADGGGLKASDSMFDPGRTFDSQILEVQYELRLAVAERDRALCRLLEVRAAIERLEAKRTKLLLAVASENA